MQGLSEMAGLLQKSGEGPQEIALDLIDEDAEHKRPSGSGKAWMQFEDEVGAEPFEGALKNVKVTAVVEAQ